MTLKHSILTIGIALSATAHGGGLDGLTFNRPTESVAFVARVGEPAAPKGLDGKNIAVWQSHGWYFEPKLNRWEWQRARIFQTVEDLYTQSYVIPYLMPMLENAGAYVMSPRERDTSVFEAVVDNDGGLSTGRYTESNAVNRWADTGLKGFAYKKSPLKNGDNPFTDGGSRRVAAVGDRSGASTAVWRADIPAAGDYAVYVSYATLPNSVDDAHYTVNTAAGPKEFRVNQRMGGGTWVYLGHFPLSAGSDLPIVELTNVSSGDGVVTADAVKIGGGMGNVARIVKEPLDDIDYQYVVSGYPRFTEGARYWLQWAGVPDSVYTPSGNVNDYTDDYKCRGEWVNYLAGGSSVLPGRKGLNIPIDLSLAFHSDAGTTRNDSIIGTLGIYFTDKGGKYANGTDRKVSGVLTDMVMSSIVNDVRATYEPKWTRRQMWDKSYYEARVPEVPAMLLELLSHQNFADMKYGLDPGFRFTVSRAIYKGMLRFLAERDGRPYVVQPLPVGGMEIASIGDGTYRLSWKATVDSLEPSAMPTRYIVEERVGNGAFRRAAEVDTEAWAFSVKDDEIHSFRVVAVNDGGRSFPGETLAMCAWPSDKTPVLIVNGFTRISGPDTFDSGDIAGFYDARDHGVPYIRDISFIGSQFEFRRDLPWMDDDAAGFGASRANYETEVIAGNTLDYVLTHGEAIRAAGYPFISMSLEAYMDSRPQPSVGVLDLILGKQKEIVAGRGVYGSRYKTFPLALQNKLTEFSKSGGDIFVTGSYIASDLWDNYLSSPEVKKADQAFAADILGYKWRVGQASVTGGAYQVPTRFKSFGSGRYEFSNTLNADCYAVESPDSFYPADKTVGCTFMRYTENNLIAGTALDDGVRKVVAIGFPFETIKSRDERNNLMRQVLSFFSSAHRSKVVSPNDGSKVGKTSKGAKSKSKKKKKKK